MENFQLFIVNKGLGEIKKNLRVNKPIN